MNTRTLYIALALAGSVTCLAQPAGVIRLDASETRLTSEGIELPIPDFADGQVVHGERNGRWTTSLRIASRNAYGLQFLIEDMRLPAGATLFLFEVDTFGEPAALRGAYTGAGPLETGQFWTDAIRGSEALLEVAYEDEQVAPLPFRIASARHLTADGYAGLVRRLDSPPQLTRPDLEGADGTTVFRGREVTYRIRDGMAVFEGDILLGEPADLEPVPASKDRRREGVGLTSTYYRWPGGVIPYTIDPALPNPTRVTDAVAHWNNTLGGVIQLVPRTTQTYFVRFTYSSNAGTCSSYVGMYRLSSGQPVNIGDYCATGNIIHEIGHAVGLFHEHTREDRDSFVRILTENISSGASSNFTQNNSVADDLGSYDYGSIMHYHATAFSSNGLPTIETIPPGIPIGQRSGLSAGDIAAVRTMYGATASAPAPASATVLVTIASNPTGRQLVVDGLTVTAPVSYQWTVGSAHTLSAPSAQIGSTQYLFTGWSNGGSQTQTVTTPSTAVTYTASFSTRHRITGVSSNTSLGSVTLSPYSADAYYTQGTTVTASAAASSSACFASWTGISAPPSSPVSIAANQPYSIVGNFQTGAVTVSPSTFTFPRNGGTGSASVVTSAGCKWSAVSKVSWIKITSGSGTSSGTLKFSVQNNSSRNSREGAIQIGAATLVITQYGR